MRLDSRPRPARPSPHDTARIRGLRRGRRAGPGAAGRGRGLRAGERIPLGESLLRIGRFGQAAQELGAVVEADPACPAHVHFALAEACAAIGAHAEAERQLLAGFARNPWLRRYVHPLRAERALLALGRGAEAREARLRIFLGESLVDRTLGLIYLPIPKNACTLIKLALLRHSGHWDAYLSDPRAISVHPAWPLTMEIGERMFPAEDDPLPGFIADVAPGRWSEYVIQKLRKGPQPNALDYLLAAGDDRTGALAFTPSHQVRPAPDPPPPALDEVAAAVERLDKGLPADPMITLPFKHGPSLGGRRPKAAIELDGSSWIAKFVSINDRDLNQPRLEGFALLLARKLGIDVPDHRIVEVGGKPVLLVHRFDRVGEGQRVHVLSVRSLLGLSERQMLGPGASYPAMAKLLRQLGRASDLGRRWFDRMVFNVAIGNTDDHALNHLASWNGKELDLMPAFDLEPQLQDPADRIHEMQLGALGRSGSVENAISACSDFGLLSGARARERVQEIIASVHSHWEATAEEAGIADRTLRARLGASLCKYEAVA